MIVFSAVLGFITVMLAMAACSNGDAMLTPSDTWSRVPHDEAVFGGEGAQMRSVIAGGPGLVAIGVDESGGDQDGAVWTSPDGTTWSLSPTTRRSSAGE